MRVFSCSSLSLPNIYLKNLNSISLKRVVEHLRLGLYCLKHKIATKVNRKQIVKYVFWSFALFLHRWTLSSRRPLTWTTWPSYTRAGPPGCECFAIALCLWSSTGLEIHQVPAGLGCWRYGTQPSGGWKWKQMLSPPFQTPGHPKWGSDLVAPLQPHSPTIGDWANTMLCVPVIPPSLQRVWPGKAMPKGEGGKGEQGLPSLENAPPWLA